MKALAVASLPESFFGARTLGAERSPSKPRKILFITRDIPALGLSRGGANVYSRDLLLHLAKNGFDVGVLLLWPALLSHRWVRVDVNVPGSPLQMVCPGYYRMFGKFWHPKGALKKAVAKITNSAKPPTTKEEEHGKIGKPLSTEEREWVRAAAQQEWDAVICNYCWLADALSYFGPQTRKVVLTHDVWHQHMWRRLGHVNLKNFDERKEKSYLELADTIIAITTCDRDHFQKMVPEKKIVVCPMSCSPRIYSAVPAPRRLLFVGSNYEANVDGMMWFLNKVAPLLQLRTNRTFQLHVVGRVGEGLTDDSSSIHIIKRGQVLDLAAEYAQAEIVIIPLCSGTGLKIKLVEAIAHGKAIVTTSVGAQGVEFLAGQAFRVADSPEKFAEVIIELSTTSERRLALERGAQDAAVKVFSPSICYQPLVTELDGARSSHRVAVK